MRYTWGKEYLKYFTKPIPKVERSYFWEIVIVIAVVIMTIIKFG